MMRVQPENIPACLRERPQWVPWRRETRDGQETKVPYDPRTHRRARTHDTRGKVYTDRAQDTWGAYEEALHAYRQRPAFYAGIGFVFTAEDPFAGLDLDDCLDENDRILPWAQPFVVGLDSYTEVSPSGRGLKIFVRARKPGEACQRTMERGKVEFYDRARFFTVTGNRRPGTPADVLERQAPYAHAYARVFGPCAPAPRAGARESCGPVPADDSDLLARACQPPNGARFAALYGGDTSAHRGDESRADLALCGMLAFWTGKDEARMDRLFRGSGLYRPKWDAKRGLLTYGERTIRQAVEHCQETYAAGTPTICLAKQNPKQVDITLQHVDANDCETVKTTAEHDAPPPAPSPDEDVAPPPLPIPAEHVDNARKDVDANDCETGKTGDRAECAKEWEDLAALMKPLVRYSAQNGIHLSPFGMRFDFDAVQRPAKVNLIEDVLRQSHRVFRQYAAVYGWLVGSAYNTLPRVVRTKLIADLHGGSDTPAGKQAIREAREWAQICRTIPENCRTLDSRTMWLGVCRMPAEEQNGWLEERRRRGYVSPEMRRQAYDRERRGSDRANDATLNTGDLVTSWSEETLQVLAALPELQKQSGMNAAAFFKALCRQAQERTQEPTEGPSSVAFGEQTLFTQAPVPVSREARECLSVELDRSDVRLLEQRARAVKASQRDFLTRWIRHGCPIQPPFPARRSSAEPASLPYGASGRAGPWNEPRVEPLNLF